MTRTSLARAAFFFLFSTLPGQAVFAGIAWAGPKVAPEVVPEADKKISPRLSTQPASGAPSATPSIAVETAPRIEELVKPEVWKRALNEREIMTHASLDDAHPGAEPDDGVKRYSYYAVMLVHSSLPEARRILTDYKLYAQMIPYIDEARFNESSKTLLLKGGIWKFKLSSLIRFEEVPGREGWIRYRIIGGHFAGLSGDMLFERQGEKGTMVYMRGEQLGREWPPAFVIERGAEIVFGFTAGRMRSYLETQSRSQAASQYNSQSTSQFKSGAKPEADKADKNDNDPIPRPKSGF